MNSSDAGILEAEEQNRELCHVLAQKLGQRRDSWSDKPPSSSQTPGGTFKALVPSLNQTTIEQGAAS